MPRKFDLYVGRINRMAIEIISAITPPSLYLGLISWLVS